MLQPPPDYALTLGLRSGGQAYRLRIEGGWIEASRGNADNADLSLAGEPADVLAALVAGEAGEQGVEIEGDRVALEALRAMVVLPDGLREAALAEIAAPTPA